MYMNQNIQYLNFWELFACNIITKLPAISGFLSPWHGVFSGCRWKNGFQTWRVVVNILYKQSWTADSGWSSSLGVAEVLTTPHLKKIPC